MLSKNSKATLSVLTLAAAIAASATASSAVDRRATSEQESGYCHQQFPALRSSTLATRHPQLKSSGSGDVIDYYGSCDHNPRGRDEVISQRHDEERHWQNDYED